MGQKNKAKPGVDWDRLYEIASAQEGHFSTSQAAGAGYSPQLLAKYIRKGRVVRVRRGIYRLVHFPAGEHEDLVALWLWTERQGVFSHETALFLHGLSDALPARVHVTLPASWKRRRLRVPGDVVLHYGDVGKKARAWAGPVPVTNPGRTLTDCAAARVSPELVRDAFEEAAGRGLVDRSALPGVVEYLTKFFSASRTGSGPQFRSSPKRTSRPR